MNNKNFFSFGIGLFGLSLTFGYFVGAPPSALAGNPQPLGQIKQVTFDGARSGEGYYSADGRQIVFQSERGSNPFYQIFLKDLNTGQVHQISNGTGKTTCAWFHPQGQKILFSSTHLDPQAKQKQEAEILRRQARTGKKYAWDFDENFDIFVAPSKKAQSFGPYKNLTSVLGYDAEASYSPDGKYVVFASNRTAYQNGIPVAPGFDPSLEMELYVMRADGSEVKRLTFSPGYDGGPFFSSDGQKIVWRRFGADGRSAEVFTLNFNWNKIDGVAPQSETQLTRLGVVSWAPYFHPSGKYVVFATNLQGHQNFEVYMVDSEGKKKPVRVTDTPGFDGLPVFSPDGKTLTWTSNRALGNQSQLFSAEWDHQAALKLLGL